MKSQIMGVLLGTFFITVNLCAQLRQIDPKKLPQDERIQKAYSNLLPVEALARRWTPKWEYLTPKKEVVSILKSSLHDLEAAEKSSPQNEELLLLEGLAAHFAYNVEAADTWDTSVNSLESAHKLAPEDYRAEWLLGIHRCESLQIAQGTEQLLAIESRTPWEKLPVEFWNDYIDCTTASLMPAHTLRAIDHATRLGASPSDYTAYLDITQGRYKTASVDATYPKEEAWQANNGASDVQFSSSLCGMQFSSYGEWHVDIRDVEKGTCVSMLESGPYPSKSGQGVPTLLLLTRTAKPQETLEDFARSSLKDRLALAQPTTAFHCPADKCLGYDIVDKNMYQPDGGGHLLLVAFAKEAPDYPGLLFEKPRELPKQEPGKKIVYYTPNPILRRLPGTLYTVVLLDSNAAIFEKAKDDFAYLLKSIQLD